MPLDHDPGSHPLQDVIGRAGKGQDVILLLQLVPRVHNPVGNIAVVGKEQQPFGVPIESANGIDPFRDVNQIHHRPPIALVFGGSDVPAWFVGCESDFHQPESPNGLDRRASRVQ
jgi:hypothetical protein